MSKVDQSKLVEEIESINKYIDEFTLERASGTKALKKKFHEQKVEERNNYVNEKIETYENYKNQVLAELENRCNVLIPTNKQESFGSRQEKLNTIENLLIYLNPYMSNNFKIGLYDLVYSLKDNMPLQNLNEILEKYIASFVNMGVTLTIKDFSYTMFIKDYFETFLNSKNDEERKVKFETVYWECPTIVSEIRQNLIILLKKYEKQIAVYTKSREDALSKENDIEPSKAKEIYEISRKDLEDDLYSDEYLVLKDFLDGKHNVGDYLKSSGSRSKIFDGFAKNNNYQELSVEEKVEFRNAIADLYHTLLYLKKYYKYEYILEDLKEKYQNRESVKANFTNIKKEIDKNDKDREKLCKEFEKNSGVGFMAKANPTKQKLNKVKMNELFTKILEDFNSYNEMKISINLDEKLHDGSNVHELFEVALSSYTYLVRMINSQVEEGMTIDIEKEIDDYIKFVNDPNGNFINGLFTSNSTEISDIIANKYILLGLSINNERLKKENIDGLINDISLIHLCKEVEDNSLSMDDIKYICEFNKIKPVDLDKNII